MRSFVTLFLTFLLTYRSAYAKKVHVIWKPLVNAVRYELEIAKGNATAFHGFIPKSNQAWNGNLTSGVYQYRVRAIDGFDRPGDWSNAKRLVVVPEAPQIKMKILKPVRAGDPIVLKWEPVTGATGFRVSIQFPVGDTTVQETTGNSFAFRESVPGIYHWQVFSELKHGEQVWRSDPSSFESFVIASPPPRVLASDETIGSRRKVSLTLFRFSEIFALQSNGDTNYSPHLCWLPSIELSRAFELRLQLGVNTFRDALGIWFPVTDGQMLLAIGGRGLSVEIGGGVQSWWIESGGTSYLLSSNLVLSWDRGFLPLLRQLVVGYSFFPQTPFTSSVTHELKAGIGIVF